jgi:hypothetical protein
MKTPNNIRTNTRNYRHTKRGVIRNIFSHITERCKKYNRELGFNSDDLLNWCRGNHEFQNIYFNWVKSGFIKNLKPSVDRKNPLMGYTFDNIQITTYLFNRTKGDSEKLILWGRPIIQYDLQGRIVNRFASIKEGAKYLNLHRCLISAVLAGQRNHTGGFKFIYDNSELLK